MKSESERGGLAKTAVIIGAGSRIGGSIAVALARRGFVLGIVDFGMDDARGTLGAVREAGGTAELYPCDVGDLEEVRTMADHCFTAWGGVGLLVNNPGVDDYGRDTGELPFEKWRQVVEGNVWGVVHACHAFIPRMIEHGGGHIANGTYGDGLTLARETAPFIIARAGVISYTERLRSELAPCGIGVTLLCSVLTKKSHLDRWLREAGFDMAGGDAIGAKALTRATASSGK